MVNVQSRSQSAKVSIAQDEALIAPRPAETMFSTDALFSGGMAVGSGFMNASVNWSVNSTEDNPIMLVRGTDVDGSQFEVEVAINNINPRNASVIELFALDGYAAANGQSASATRAAARESAMSVPNSFTPISNLFDALKEMIESQRFHGNIDGYVQYRDLLEFLSGFPR